MQDSQNTANSNDIEAFPSAYWWSPLPTRASDSMKRTSKNSPPA